MNSRIRPAQPADLDAVCAIALSSPFAARWTRTQYAAEIDSSRSEFAVLGGAPGEGQVQGYLVMLRVPPEAQLVDLAVRPDGRGQGRGRALLEYAAGKARAWGCAKMTLEVSAANGPAQRLYGSAGFKVVGRRRNFYNDGSDAILMDLLLT